MRPGWAGTAMICPAPVLRSVVVVVAPVLAAMVTVLVLAPDWLPCCPATVMVMGLVMAWVVVVVVPPTPPDDTTIILTPPPPPDTCKYSTKKYYQNVNMQQERQTGKTE